VKRLAFAIALLALLQPIAGRPARSQVFRSGVEVVPLDVSVTRGGATVRGLTARDFIVTDNGVEQAVESVTLDELPLNVQVVLDVSGSVSGERLRHLIAAGNGVLSALRPGDRVGLLTFSHALRVRALMTDDITVVGDLLARITGEGPTALRDAVQLGLTLSANDRARALLLVFTDGVDNASWLSEDAVVDSARRAGIVVHVVRVRSQEDTRSNFVEQLTEAAGGRVWSASSERDLDQLFTGALDEMRGRYLLTFSPSGPTRPGWHELKVRLRNSRGDVKARPGYFVNP
jgi:VWFA-related protein